MFKNKGLGAQIQLLITLISVAIAVINFFIVARLAPLSTNLSDLTNSVKAYEDANSKQHDAFITQATFEVLLGRVDHISSRVDSIYSIVAQIKK
jgi:hypothetical protein